MPHYILKCYLLLKLACHLVRTRTTMEISNIPIAFCVILGIVIMCNTIVTVQHVLNMLLNKVKSSLNHCFYKKPILYGKSLCANS